MSRVRRLALISTSLAVAASGMLTAATTSATADTAAATPAVHVYIAKGRMVFMPDRIQPGVQRFAVRSARRSGFQVIRPAAGYNKFKAAHDVNRAFNKNNMKALKRFENHVDLLGGVPSAPGSNGVMWLDLAPGRYWAVDTNLHTVTPDKILTVHVAGTPTGATLRRGAVVRAINETDFAKRPRTIPHRGRLTFRNDSADNHFIDLAKLKPGKTIKDFRHWINQAKQGKQSPPPVVFGAETSSGVVSPGHEMTMRYRLPRGKYVLVCWWPDAEMGGMPHAFMGMYREITLK